MRVQLAAPLAGIVPQETYNQLFTMHGSVMMFLFAVPAIEAMAVMLLPQMLAARDLPFPRLSAYSYWTYAIGGVVFFGTIFFSLAPADGWFMYPPLSSGVYSKGINADFWLLGIGFIEISAIAGAIELVVGVLRTRAPGMSLAKMPIYAWAVLIFGVMILLAFPSMILVTFLLELERAFNWPLFDATRGGDPLLYQHLFWFFGHPDVYIIFIPASAMVSTMVVTIAQKRLVGHEIVVLAMIATGFISFGVWAHHMFTVGMPGLAAGYFSAASMAVAIPAGAQVFAWIATLASGKVQRNVPSLFLVGGILIFVLGGLSGVMVGMVAFDGQAHDTYFVVAHFHYVLIGGMLFPLFAGFYYWTPMINSRRLSEKVGRWVFWLSFIGVHVCFLPMHLTGLMGMPRRVDTYLPHRFWEIPNLISTVGAFIMAAGALLFLIDAIRCYVAGRNDADNAGNVFNGGTLEWLPTGNYSVRSIPVVRDMEPLWVVAHVGCGRRGRALLPARHHHGGARNADHQHLARRAAVRAGHARAVVVAVAGGAVHSRLLPAADGQGDHARRDLRRVGRVRPDALAVGQRPSPAAKAGRCRRRHLAADLRRRPAVARLVGRGAARRGARHDLPDGDVFLPLLVQCAPGLVAGHGTAWRVGAGAGAAGRVGGPGVCRAAGDGADETRRRACAR